MTVGRGDSLAQAVGAEVDEGDARLGDGLGDEDVLELQVSVRDAGLVQRGERVEDAEEDRLQVVITGCARAREPGAQRLPLRSCVAHPVAPLALAGVETRRKAGVQHVGNHAVRRQKAMHGALVARGLGTEHLEDSVLAVAPRRVRNRELALAELTKDEEMLERVARGDLLARGRIEPREVANAWVHRGPRREDDVDERVDAIAVVTVLCESLRKASLCRRSADVVGIEAQETLANRGHFLEREEPFELRPYYVDRRVHLGAHTLPYEGARGCYPKRPTRQDNHDGRSRCVIVRTKRALGYSSTYDRKIRGRCAPLPNPVGSPRGA